MTEYEFVGDANSFATGPQSDPVWDAALEHRGTITVMLAQLAEQGVKTICVLGAGPCNDIDVKVLCSVFQQVTLVDIDEKTLSAGVAKQKASGLANLKLLGNVDLFGASDALDEFQQSKDDSLIDPILDAVSQHKVPELGTYDCVVSTCLLSQLLWSVTKSVGESHPRFVDVLVETRLRHLKLTHSALNVGGHGLLVTDIVSSDSLPDLLNDGIDLKETLRVAINEKNFLHGLNPLAITNTFAGEEFAGALSSVGVSAPWRWAAPVRTYLCFAIKFVRSK